MLEITFRRIVILSFEVTDPLWLNVAMSGSLFYRLIFLLLLWPISILFGATYYVDSNALDDLGDGSALHPKKYISSGISLMTSLGGDILTIRSGIYNAPQDEISNTVNGVPGSYNRIMADVDGSVIITKALLLPLQAQYLTFEGLRWESQEIKHATGHHLKFLRCGFQGGEPNGNRKTFSIGTNDQTPGAHHVLVEDCWFYGLGGRYNLLVFNSQEIILRRIVARHDGGWDGSAGSNPEAAICIYDSKDVLVQNAICLDNTLDYFYWEASFYLNKNNNTSTPSNHIDITGLMVLNCAGVAIKLDGAGEVTNATIRDSFVSGVSGAAVATNGGGQGHSLILENNLLAQNLYGVLGGGSSGSQIETLNCIVADHSGGAFRNNSFVVDHQFTDCFNNGGNPCDGVGDFDWDPYLNGLLYPVRLESDSPLRSAGEFGGRVGPEIMNIIGVSGTLYGEPGFDQKTALPLWPWPLEDRIKAEMCDDINSGVQDRGWCSSAQSLTEYIWESLGNPYPCVGNPDQDHNAQIDVRDATLVINHLGEETHVDSDVNCDGITSLNDLSLFFQSWKK